MATEKAGGGGGGKSSAVRAGAAFVELFGDDTKLRRALSSAQARLQSFAKSSFSTSLGLAATSAGLLAPVAAIGASLIDEAANMQRLSDRFKLPVESISELAYVFRLAGISSDEFADTIKDGQERISLAADGQDEAFRRVGLNARELVSLPIDQQFAKIADALGRVRNPADRTAIAMEILGESGDKLLPVLGEGSARLRELTAEARASGAVLSGETAQSALAARNSFSQLWAEIRAAALTFFGELSPSILEVTQTLRTAVPQIRNFVRENRDLLAVAGKVAIGIGVAGVAILGLSVSSGALSIAFGVASVAAKVLGFAVSASFAVATAPIALVVGSIAAVTAGLVLASTNVSTLGGIFRDVFGGIGSVFSTVSEEVQEALAEGNFQHIGEVLKITFNSLMEQIGVGFSRIWNELSRSIEATATKLKTGASNVLNNAQTGTAKGINSIPKMIPLLTGGLPKFLQPFAMKLAIRSYETVFGEGSANPAINEQNERNLEQMRLEEQQRIVAKAKREEEEISKKYKEEDAVLAKRLQAEQDKLKEQLNVLAEQRKAAKIAREQARDAEQIGPMPREVFSVIENFLMAVKAARQAAQKPIGSVSSFASTLGSFRIGNSAFQQFSAGPNMAQRSIVAAEDTAKNTAVIAAKIQAPAFR